MGEISSNILFEGIVPENAAPTRQHARHSTINRKVTTIFLVLFVLAAANVVVLEQILDATNNVAETVNIAGRLRMLSQKIALETLHSANGASTTEVKALHTVNEFDAALDVLRHGGTANGYLIKKLAPRHEVLLGTLTKNWLGFREQVVAVLSSPVRSSAKLDRVAEDSASVLHDADSLVGALTVEATQAQSLAYARSYVLLTVDSVLLILVFLAFRRKIVYPLRTLYEANLELAEGNFHTHVKYRSTDEIGQLAEAFNYSAQQIGMLIDKLEEERQRTLEAESMFRGLIESVSDAFVAVNRDWRIMVLNSKAALAAGKDKESLIGMDLRQALSVGPAAWEVATEAMRERKAGTTDCFHKTSGCWWEVRAYPSPDGLVMIATDISERKKAEELAQHDPLTGMPNRALLYEFSEHALAAAKRDQTCTAFLFIDLDRFKPINDTYGHKVGDAVLKQVATRLSQCIRASDLVARLGGDEFLAVLPQLGSEQNAATVAQHALECLRQPYLVDGLELTVTPSIGISLFPQDGLEIDELIQNADAAMYHTKENRQNDFQFFKAEFNQRTREALRIESHLRQALANREFVLYYQPVIDTETSEVVGAEALLRWPAMNVEPAQFIPVAENAGMMPPLGEWVLHEACRQQRLWAETGGPSVPIAVNVSPLQFRQKNFLESVSAVIGSADIAPVNLRLEITEGTLLRDAEAARHILLGLREIGVKVALDDFGTGYSSLGYLSRLPVDILKLDRSFVQEIGHHGPSAAIAKGIISLGHSLGLEVIAEGVESSDALAFLRRQHCDRSQGFYVSPPMSPEQFERWCAQRAT